MSMIDLAGYALTIVFVCLVGWALIWAARPRREPSPPHVDVLVDVPARRSQPSIAGSIMKFVFGILIVGGAFWLAVDYGVWAIVGWLIFVWFILGLLLAAAE